MKGSSLLHNKYAMSEVIGSIILVLVAVMVFSVIYLNVTSKDIDVYKTNIKIVGSVTDEGLIVLEHIGGDEIESYTVYVFDENDNLIGSKIYDETWTIGESKYPLKDITNIKLVNETVSLSITVYTINEDGDSQEIFSGILSGKVDTITYGLPPGTPIYDPSFPLLISSLRNDTIDEDLICFNFTENMSITPLTHIYKWILDGSPFAEVILPFDTENNIVAKDYSGNGYNGTVDGATWSNEGQVGGSYFFGGGGDHIEMDLPSAFNNIGGADFTISFWVKSSDIVEPHKVIMEASQSNKNFARFFQYETQFHFGVCIDGAKYVLKTDNLTDDTWYNIVGTWQGSTDTIGLYFNGEAIDSDNTGYRLFSLSSYDGSFNIGHGAPGGGGFWHGYIDEVEVYPQILSADQIYQNYLSTKNGFTDRRVIVSAETNLGQIWQCVLTPNDGIQDDISVESNSLQIVAYPGGD